MKKKILFPKKKQIGKRPWGKEELLVLIPKILTLKKLTIKNEMKLADTLFSCQICLLVSRKHFSSL